MRILFFLCLMPVALMSVQNQGELRAHSLIAISPQEEDFVQTEEEETTPKEERLFKQAYKRFNPWYTGPLVVPSATMMPPAIVNYQPYVFVKDFYQRFNSSRTARSIPNRIQLATAQMFQTGITDWMDAMIVIRGAENWQHHKNGGSFGDCTFALGWRFCKQWIWEPDIKFALQETFPTGRFNHLSSNGLALEGVGMGSYQTTASLSFSKVLFWDSPYPMNGRFYVGYTVPTTVHVAGFNTYGGGFGARAKVRPGNRIDADLGLEWNVSKPWVLILDLIYTYTNRTSFTGKPGVTKTGKVAPLGNGASDNLSLAPVIEYNWNENLAVIFGAWCSVYGRNSDNFASGLFSLTWTFGPRSSVPEVKTKQHKST